MPTGEIEPRQVERLKEMGAWLAQYGESIYGTRGGPYKPTKAIASTRVGNSIYLHVFQWASDTLTLPPLPRKVVGWSLLTGGTAQVTRTPEALTIQVPRRIGGDGYAAQDLPRRPGSGDPTDSSRLWY